jgi:hypothetical protein
MAPSGLRLLDPIHVNLFQNRGGGTFSPALRPTGNTPTYEAILADLDRDGHLDLAANDIHGACAVLLNNGGGGFEKSWGFGALGIGPLGAGDLNGDGALELVLSEEQGDRIVVISNVAAGPANRDCNQNDVPDACDIASGTSPDCDRSKVPDECEIAKGQLADADRNGIPDACDNRPAFHRGDANADGRFDVSDCLCTLSFLFQGAGNLSCDESADANNDGSIDCSDALYAFGFLFLGTEAPPSPGPPPAACGQDPDPPGSLHDLGCESYRGCPAP